LHLSSFSMVDNFYEKRKYHCIKKQNKVGKLSLPF